MTTATRQNISARESKASEVSAPFHIRHSQRDLWENWGRTARCQPVRVAASGHSWSTLVPTDGVLVYIHALNRVSLDLKTFP